MLPERKRLPHTPPPWVPDDAVYFITINCAKRYANTLAHSTLANALFDTVIYREKLLQWNVDLMLLMPDHLHAFIAFSQFQSITKTISDWKQYTSKKLGINWQSNFFDHRIRNQAELDEKWSYVLNNPVRAGLCNTPEDWPYKR
ncbi:transposase [Pelagicoccus sp. SDUM812003]|uniref:REP-associated tyrosine transposase n=1 Tax=Pelagicoccus sp. SDUM812003 TaxID=3041267 RepID=UPI00280DB4A5|nr:transposase [Pelagicoccus sp. SDUM812003]MDQ8204504.1 transposase [Pelagicoccus sp. SDUM812003]